MNYYKQTIDQTLDALKTSTQGLDAQEADRRLGQYGPNLVKIKGEPLWRKLLEPFKSVFMFVLALAAVISLITEERIDALFIVAIIAITVIIYYAQRFSTERVLKALENHQKQMVQVRRGDLVISIDSTELVPGDIIYLNEGEKVPADARLLHSNNGRADESLLTGESVAVSKNSHVFHSNKQVYEQSNMLFQGAYIVTGSVSAVVTATGNNTQFGQLAALATKTDLTSPVRQKIDKLISLIVAGVAILAALVFALSLYRGIQVGEALRLILTLSVSAVPESLPVAISVVLVLGMRRMAKQNALVRNMRAIENVGLVTTIATDKTGTLTKNELSVQDVWSLSSPSDLKKLAKLAYLSITQNDGKLHDPLDNAFMNFATKYEVATSGKSKLVEVMPFEHRFAMSGNVWKHTKGYDTYIKGAPEKIVAISKLTSSQKKQITEALHSFTGSGYRVLALAKDTNRKNPAVDLESLQKQKLDFVGLVAVADELRREARPAVISAQQAGVTVRMITGDHFETAYSIGKKLGLVKHRDQVFDCTDLDKVSDKALREKVADLRVFARVLPEHKHRILGILKEHGITAMTGDGVNDVPALTNAHIGVAMGAGSQIAKEAGDIVLLDNNFKSIVVALSHGRTIFDNIKRMLFYLISTNLGEALTTVCALIIGLPLPLLPSQILWTNLGTDSAMVIPLGLEPPEKDVMNHPPRDPEAPIIDKVILSRMLLVGLTMMTLAVSFFSYYLGEHSVEYARTIVLNILVTSQLTNAFNARSEWQSLFTRLKVVNPKFYIGLLAALCLHWLALRGPANEILHLTYVPWRDLLMTASVASGAIIAVNEIHKFIGRKWFGAR